MSVRFNIKDDYKAQHEIALWMNKHIGLIEEDKTWFWDTEQDSEEHVGRCREGIRIWKDVPAVSFAIIKWGVGE